MKKGKPRSGSMQVWPRVRAKKKVARVRSYPKVNEAKLLGFAAYKAGMTHTLITGQDKNKMNSGLETFTPVTVLECPPMKIASARVYKNGQVVSQINFKTEKELSRATNLPKKTEGKEALDKLTPEEFDEIRVQVYTLPKLIDLKKTPEMFEMSIGGSANEQLEYVKNNFDKPIPITDVLNEGLIVDAHAVTKGKGFQGPVKRFGISLKAAKSEKGRRQPGSLGGWKAQGHVMYRVPHAGQTGYHLRTQHNNLILKISDKPEEVNPKGGFVKYGLVKSNYLLIKGSIPGPKNRLITLTRPIRQHLKPKHSSESITYISTESQQ
jgi:large subunit ribosomal protein L3